MNSETIRENLDNTELVSLLLDFNQNQTTEKYANIVSSLQTDSHVLLLPSVDDGQPTGEWKNIPGGSELKLNCIFNMNGIKVLAVFTSELTMNAWAKSPIHYTALKSSDVLKLSLQWEIDRIVIDSDQPSMFSLIKSESRGEQNVQDKSKLYIMYPPHPLKPHVLAYLAANFLQVESILEAFQFTLSDRSQPSLILGLKLSDYSPQSKENCFSAVQDAFKLYKPEGPVDVIFLEKEDWHTRVCAINGSLFYRRPKDII